MVLVLGHSTDRSVNCVTGAAIELMNLQDTRVVMLDQVAAPFGSPPLEKWEVCHGRMSSRGAHQVCRRLTMNDHTWTCRCGKVFIRNEESAQLHGQRCTDRLIRRLLGPAKPIFPPNRSDESFESRVANLANWLSVMFADRQRTGE